MESEYTGTQGVKVGGAGSGLSNAADSGFLADGTLIPFKHRSQQITEVLINVTSD